MVFAVTDRLSSCPLKVKRGGVEEDHVVTAEKIPAQMEQLLLDDIFGDPRREGRAIRLVFHLFPEIGHSPVQVVGRQAVYAMDAVALPLQNHKRTLGEPGKGTNEAFNISLALQLINAAYCSNNPLDALFVLPVVFYDLEVFIPPCLLDSRKHGAPSLTPIIYRS